MVNRGTPTYREPRPVRTESDRRTRVLRLWRSVEYFSAQDVKGPDAALRQLQEAGTSGRRYAVDPDGPAPWEPGHPLRRVRLPPGRVWRYSLYGGVFSLDRLHRTLADVFEDDGRDVDERTPRGDSALFAVSVSPNGRLQLESLTFSQAAWALGRTLDPGPDKPGWLDGFDDAAAALGRLMTSRVQEWDDDQTKVMQARAVPIPPGGTAMSARLVRDLTAMVADAWGVGAALAPDAVLVRADAVDARHVDQVADTDFLNSLVADDLDRVARAAASGDVGAALTSYLSDEADASARLDVRDPAMLDAVVDLLAPDRVPEGRWPADPTHSLVTSQQLAVNQIRSRLCHGSGLFGVNGPPGTGKTTMLRELVAATVVDRAHRLAVLASPHDAFESDSWTGWSAGRRKVRFRRLRPELTGFEIVVASSNNGAVENISRELPDRRSVEDPWVDADYLSEHANRLLGVGDSGVKDGSASAWGLLAATLGNKRNRSTFVNRLWFSPTTDDRSDAAEPRGLKDWLADQQCTTGPDLWRAAVDRFESAAAAEHAIRARRQRAFEALHDTADLISSHERAVAAVAAANTALVRARAAVAPARAEYEHAAAEAEVARERRREHRRARPPWWEVVFTLGGAARRWHAEDAPRARRQQDDENTEERARGGLRTAQEAVERSRRAFQDAARAEQHAERRLAGARRTVADVVASMTGPGASRHVPDRAWRSDEAARERYTPWLDPSWNAARTNLFLAALDLHRAFLVRSGNDGMAMLRAAMDVVRGAPRDAPADAVLSAWQGLFLLTPVVSTTFASVARMLPSVGSEAFGWLLIDEAGQAAPQAAAGAMWRARRVVAVGDPLQLEPVVTALHTTQARMRDHYGVSDLWLPSQQSVQTLTDRVTPLGTHLRRDDDALWVGAPLRVHRRCAEPMFSVVNDAVYNGLMLHGAPGQSDRLGVLGPDVEERDPPVLDRPVRGSMWVDVRGEAEGNWIPAEGEAAIWVLRGLLGRHGLRTEDILVVSPFRAVAGRLRPVIRSTFGSGITCGTVHVSQGKEASAVVLVLGGGTQGARSWAAARPNLMNVAVSRAKDRLYVVGERDQWKGLPYFDVLAARLGVYAFGDRSP